MVIFHSYVSLPEGTEQTYLVFWSNYQPKKMVTLVLQFSPPCCSMERGSVAKEQGPRILEVQGIDCRVEADDTSNASGVL